MCVQNFDGFASTLKLRRLRKRAPVPLTATGIQIENIVTLPLLGAQMKRRSLTVTGDNQRGALPGFPRVLHLHTSCQKQQAR